MAPEPRLAFQQEKFKVNVQVNVKVQSNPFGVPNPGTPKDRINTGTDERPLLQTATHTGQPLTARED